MISLKDFNEAYLNYFYLRTKDLFLFIQILIILKSQDICTGHLIELFRVPLVFRSRPEGKPSVSINDAIQRKIFSRTRRKFKTELLRALIFEAYAMRFR